MEKSKQAQFEQEYGRNGAWFKFYESCSDYLGHDLMKDTNTGDYLLVDKWMSKADYEHFVKSHLMEYDNLNKQSREYYDTEELIGTFETI